MDKLEAILARIPHYYNKDENSQIYNILKAFADEYEIVYADYISRADSAIGIDTTLGKDLDWRWGSLLNVARQPNENDASYRNRLELSVGALQGGTAESIRYAVAVFLGFSSDIDKTNRCIAVYDGWKYDNAELEMQSYGHVICVLTLDGEDDDIYYDGIEDDIIKIVEMVKAAGIVAHVIVAGIRHYQLTEYTYQYLSTMSHKQIRRIQV